MLSRFLFGRRWVCRRICKQCCLTWRLDFRLDVISFGFQILGDNRFRCRSALGGLDRMWEFFSIPPGRHGTHVVENALSQKHEHVPECERTQYNSKHDMTT